ncbi:hypothetical protein PABG_11694 [Paracoccidioides brasiliensis Pb03]|nr:hypothetical protein PABG_11694 [Paracoccidioides brasiliensis Pb03]
MIEDSNLLRGSPILVQIAKWGVRVTAVTAMHKLRMILVHDPNISKTSTHRAQKRQLGERLGRLVELGALVAVTGDHGLSHKARATLKETEN